MPRPTPRNATLLIFLLACMAMLGPFTIDLYLPAFPEMEETFGTSETMVQFTLTATAMGFAVGQLFVGPWSDKAGRRRPLLICSAIHVMACIGAVFAPSIQILIALRIVQGAAAASSLAVARAAVRDMFEGEKLVKALGRLALVSGLAPLIAPVIGSQLLRFTSWRGVFVFLALYGALMFLAVLFVLPETLPPERRSVRGNNYGLLLHDKKFMGIVLAGGAVTGVMFTYLASASFVFQDYYHLTPQVFGLAFMVMAFGTWAGFQVGSKLMQHFSPKRVYLGAVSVLALSCIVVVIASGLSSSMWAPAIPLWIAMLCMGISFIAMQVLALQDHPNEAGSAAALIGSCQFGVSALATPIAGFIGLSTMVPMAFVMLGFSLLALLCLLVAFKPGRKTLPV